MSPFELLASALLFLLIYSCVTMIFTRLGQCCSFVDEQQQKARRMSTFSLTQHHTRAFGSDKVANSYFFLGQLLTACCALGTFFFWADYHPDDIRCTAFVWLPLAPFFRPLLPATWYLFFMLVSNGKDDELRALHDNAWTNTMVWITITLFAGWLATASIIMPLVLCFVYVPLLLGAAVLGVVYVIGRVNPIVNLRVVAYWGIFGEDFSDRLLGMHDGSTEQTNKLLLGTKQIPRWWAACFLERGGMPGNRNGLRPKERRALQFLQRVLGVFIFTAIGSCVLYVPFYRHGNYSATTSAIHEQYFRAERLEAWVRWLRCLYFPKPNFDFYLPQWRLSMSWPSTWLAFAEYTTSLALVAIQQLQALYVYVYENAHPDGDNINYLLARKRTYKAGVRPDHVSIPACTQH
jgi:hypothetical protein